MIISSTDDQIVVSVFSHDAVVSSIDIFTLRHTMSIDAVFSIPFID